MVSKSILYIGFLLADSAGAAAVLYNNIELLTSTKSSLIVIESMFLKFLSLKQKTWKNILKIVFNI